MHLYIYGLLLLFDELLPPTLASGNSALPVGPDAGMVDCVKANDMCNQNAACSSRYRVMRQCLVGRDRNTMLANKECQAAIEVLQDTALFSCRCKRGMKKELQCLQSYWSFHMGHGEAEEFYEASPYERFQRLAPIQVSPSSTQRGSAHCLDTGSTCNPCLDATKNCNLNDTCKRQRSTYIATCNKGQGQGQGPPQPQDTCNRKRCHKALRQFFDRVQTEHSYGLLFCSCRDQACAERRRQTIVPACSFEEKNKPNCLELRKTCRTDPLCRSRLADFHAHCLMTPESINGCPNEDYQACLASYVGLIGTDMTPNYVDHTPTNFTISPWCSCRGSGNKEEECERFLQDFRENSCLRYAIQEFGSGTDRSKPATIAPTTSVKPYQEVSVHVTKTTANPESTFDCLSCTNLGYGETCNSACDPSVRQNDAPREPFKIKDPINNSAQLKGRHAWMWITCLTPLLGVLAL
ncbi:GDNF family receptor alpha-2a isoform X2 [Engraulis encrasicolus]|uniref:GDNF family receptor alpha-2a isoform X2 n=1 Tax=Engraulis encrasicolus TaxID=184585 RepID=UPI002FCF55BF